jgi:hypothetical protein
MRLGIYTRYYRHEATYAAIRIATFAQSLGYDVSLFTDDRANTRVHRDWDRRVQRRGPKGFTEWADKCDIVCWTHAPPVAQMTWANDKGKSTILLALWHELGTEHRKVFRRAKTVLCPTVSVAALLAKRWRLQNCRVAMWDPGLPFVTKPKPTMITSPKILIPTDLCCPKMTPAFALLLASVIETCPDVSMTMSYVPSRWRASELCDLRGLCATGRFKLVPSIAEEVRPLLFQRHDLTLWPALNDNFAYGALYSLAMGTPVLAFGGPAADEAISGTNSVCIATQLRESPLGVPSVIPDYPAYLDHLLGIILDPLMLPEMLDATVEDLLQRRRQFAKVLSFVLHA